MFKEERRRSERVLYRLNAESMINNQTYRGVIENFSREGMLKIIPNGEMLDMLPGTKLMVTFQIPSGEKVSLNCEIKWLRHYPNMPHGIKHYIGMEIINPADNYKEFAQTLYREYSGNNIKNGKKAESQGRM